MITSLHAENKISIKPLLVFQFSVSERGGSTPALDVPPLHSPYYYTPPEPPLGRPAATDTAAVTTTTSIWSLAKMTTTSLQQPSSLEQPVRADRQQQQLAVGRADLPIQVSLSIYLVYSSMII